MKQRILITSIVATAILASFVSSADTVDDYIQAEMNQRRIPGIALSVVQNGKPVKTAAYGLANLELNAPVKLETVFEIGSITKQFTAAAILLLQQDGKVSVEDLICRHLQNLPNAWSNITVRHLLTHTSGIKSYTGLNGFELTRHLSQEQFIKALGAHPLEFQPGDSWKYSNSGYNLLGYIVENVSGKPYWDFLDQRIFRPLGMTATTDRRPSSIILNRADGYEQTNHIHINRDYDITDVFSAGAIVSSVLDLVKWNTALDTDIILKSETKERMWTSAVLNNSKPARYGFGWSIDAFEGHKNIGHGGSTSGFSASIQRFPDDKLAVIVLTNTDEQIASTLARKIASFYLVAKAGPAGI